jgi:CHASE2 domain-containing sensor protein
LTTAEKPKWRPLLLAAVCVWAAVHLIHFGYPEGLDTWNERLVDRFFLLKTRNPAWQTAYDDSIVHIDLNNTSLRVLKDFHPSRAHYARVIANLGKIKVALQMCDIIFAGETSASNDRMLMEATRAARAVVFGMAFRLVADPQPREESAQDPHALAYLRQSLWKLPASRAVDGFYTGVDPLITHVPLAELSLGLGFLTLIPDPDGVIRRLPLNRPLRRRILPEFCPQIGVRLFQSAPRPRRDRPGIDHIEGGPPAGIHRRSRHPHPDRRPREHANSLRGPLGPHEALSFFGCLRRGRRP